MSSRIFIIHIPLSSLKLSSTIYRISTKDCTALSSNDYEENDYVDYVIEADESEKKITINLFDSAVDERGSLI
jgi:hypothetical protein